MKRLLLAPFLILFVWSLSACTTAPATPVPTPASQVEAPEPTAEPKPTEEPEPTAEPEPTMEPEPEIAAATITASMDGFEAPAELSAGWTAITLVNESDGLRQAALLRFEEGKTMPDLAAAMAEGAPGTPPWLTPIGGPSGVTPGSSGTALVHLQPGNYVMLDPVPDDQGVPGVAKGYIMPFTVVEAAKMAGAPEADLTLETVDYSFLFDSDAVSAGEHTIRITNSGPQEAHEVAIIRLNEGATVQDFLAALAPDAPPGPPPGVGVAGLAGLAVGEEAYLTVALEPGVSYGLICFLPSTEHEGTPHFMLGMVGEFTVPGE